MAELETFELSNGQRLVYVHPRGTCKMPRCTIHNPSEHHMRDWPLIWRGDGPFDIWRGFERICPHGIGHPDPDDLAFKKQFEEDSYAGVHGCDGCCCPPERRLRELQEGEG